METIGKRMKVLREKQHMAQNQVAEKLGITVQCYGCYERDVYQPSYKVLKTMIDALDWDVTYLLYGEQEHNRPMDQLYSKCPEEDKRLFGEMVDGMIDRCLETVDGEEQFQYCLYKYRMEHRYTNSAMASILGVSNNRYSRLENGTVAPDLKVIDTIYKKLKIDPTYFLSGRRWSCDTINEKLGQLEKNQQKRVYQMAKSYIESIS